MQLPPEVPVMVLPNITLFPQAMLPLFIVEPRYRRMLADVLQGNRMFSVAMQRPGQKREIPLPVAGLGLVRAAVTHVDGTSHLVLQGLSRIELTEAVRYRPYRVNRIRALYSPPTQSVEVGTLTKKVRELVREHMKHGPAPPTALLHQLAKASNVDESSLADLPSVEEFVSYLGKLDDPNQLADLVSCALLPSAMQRQAILSTVDLEERLRQLIHFLLAEIQRQKKNPSHE